MPATTDDTAEEQREIETGVETDSDNIRTMDWEVEAWADDGEYATVWFVRGVDETHVEVQTLRAEAGMREIDGAIEVYEIGSDAGVVDFARELANADPEEAVTLAREYFADQ